MLNQENINNNNNRWLEKFKKNVYSQCGEDGVIEKILEILPDKNKWCVEFGAWDGKYLSNTYNLTINHGFSCVIIESDAKKFIDLQRTYSNNKAAITLNKYVDTKGENSLDNILLKTEIPKDFDFLSIDIDGNDYFVWESIKLYRPKIICIEFNPTIPNELGFVQENNPKIKQGASLLSIKNLGAIKGYELVCALGWNAIFVEKKYYDLFGIDDNSLEVLRQDKTFITYIFVGYDGRIFTRGLNMIGWHKLEFDENDIQILPKVFRKYALDFNPLEMFLFNLYRKSTKIKKRIHNFVGKLLSRIF